MHPFRNSTFHSCLLLSLLAVLLTACTAPVDIRDYAMDTPMPSPTAGPYIGEVGQRVAYYGWSVEVNDVFRSSINPVEDQPEYARRYGDEYISMNVTVERSAGEKDEDYIYGDLFSLQDSAGNIYQVNPFIDVWDFAEGNYYPGTARTGRVVIPVPSTAQGLRLRFTPSSELPGPLEVALGEIKSIPTITLVEAIQKGLITANVRGLSLENIVVEVSLEGDDSDGYEVVLEPGTAFLAPSPDLQTMIVREGFSFYIGEEEDSLSLNVEVACANMRLEAPSGGEAYIVQIQPPAEELRKLLGLPEFQQANFRLQQFAIWTITDKPARDGYVGLGVGGEGSPPSRDELQTIASWFQQAGLSLSDYPALP